MIAAGAALALLAFRGGARWLIPPRGREHVGASVCGGRQLDFRGGMGDRDYRPLAASSIPADGYRLGIGRLTVDLRDLDWSARRRSFG